MNDKRNPGDPIPLAYPVKFGNQEYTSLTMRRPKVRDSLRAEAETKTDAEREVALFAILCGVPRDVIADLDEAADYPLLQDEYTGFFVSAPTNSEFGGAFVARILNQPWPVIEAMTHDELRDRVEDAARLAKEMKKLGLKP